MKYSLPRDIYEVILAATNSKESADKVANAIEYTIQETRESLKLSIKDDIRSELATKKI